MPRFKQPSGQFTIYDSTQLAVPADVSTPLKLAVVTFENQIRGDKLETGAFFDEVGHMVVQRQGVPNQVSFSDVPALLLSGRTFTHNHPGGASFSKDDVVSAAELQLAQVRVVTRTMRFSLTPMKPYGWPTREAVLSAINASKGRAEWMALQRAVAGEIDSAYIRAEAEHLAWAMSAQKLALIYTREKS